MSLIDTHAHLNDPNFPLSAEEAVARAREAGVAKMIVPGMNWSTSERAVELANQFPGVVYAAVGFHPHNVLQRGRGGVGDSAIDGLRKLYSSTRKQSASVEKFSSRLAFARSNNNQIVAIGEVGIDYHHYDKEETGLIQQESFAKQLELSVELDLPAIVHGRGAYEDVLGIIRNYPTSRGVLHSFEAPYEVAKQALDLGWLVSFTALITYPKYDWLREVVSKLPLDRIMIETDSPYLLPQELRKTNHNVILSDSEGSHNKAIDSSSTTKVGTQNDRLKGLRDNKRRSNEPANVVYIAKKIAEIKKVDLEDVAEVTAKNAERLFRLTPQIH